MYGTFTINSPFEIVQETKPLDSSKKSSTGTREVEKNELMNLGTLHSFYEDSRPIFECQRNLGVTKKYTRTPGTSFFSFYWSVCSI